MSDYPERMVESMRRQLELVLELEDDVVDELLECDLPAEIRAVDGLDEDDADHLVHVNGNGDLERVFSIDEADAEIILEMSDEIRLLGEAEYSIQRHEFYLRRCLSMAKAVGGLADALEDKDAAEEIVTWINTEQTGSAETNKDYRTALRMFSGIVTEGDTDDKPASIDWVPGGYPKNYDPAPQPEKMYRWEEHIQPMLGACNNSRDRALVALAWDLGPRPGELYDLEFGRFSDHKYGKKVTLYQGKQGTRSPVLITSTPYVNEWLEDHPGGAAEDPLWTRRNRCTEVTDQRVRDVFKEIVERADMVPPSTPTPTRMRKSSASHLASEGVSQAHLEMHHGWKTGSDQAARYIAVFGDANDREIAKAHGLEIEEETGEPIAPVPCPRCGQETPREKDFCMHCQQILDRETKEVFDEVLDLLDDRSVEAEDAEDRREFLSARRTLEEKPHVMDADDLHEFAASLSD